jgi:hypothetical protein
VKELMRQKESYVVSSSLIKEQSQFNGEREAFSTSSGKTTGCLHVKTTTNLDTDPTTFIKINSK